MQKVRGFAKAVGYWGRNPQCRVLTDQTAAKVQAMIQDQLRANGSSVTLYQPLLTGAPCSCRKSATANADAKCMSCYGTGRLGGYQRFLFETLFFGSTTPGSGTLVLDQRRQPNRLVLAPTALTGQWTTAVAAFSNMTSEPWELELVAFRRAAGDALALEVDSGGGWQPVTVTEVQVGPETPSGPMRVYRGVLDGPLRPIGVGTLRARITLTRSVVSSEPPAFEALRVRHLRRLDMNPLGLRGWTPGDILVAKTGMREQTVLDTVLGRQTVHEADQSFTAPLSFFDQSLVANTPSVVLDNREQGFSAFYVYSTGVRQGQRYAVTNVTMDATIAGTLTHQQFAENLTQPGDVYHLVF